MDKIDGYFKSFFKGRGKMSTNSALSDDDVQLFIQNRLEGERLERVLERLESSSEDRELVLVARQRIEAISEASNERVDDSLIRAVVPPTKSPARQKVVIGFWGGVSLAGLVLSFVFPRYFAQCLAAAVIAGFKWAAESRALKTQALIYRALEEPLEAPKRDNLQRDDARL